MFKTLVCLCQAAILVGMSGIAPYAAGHCARQATGGAMASMPGMWHGHADRGTPALESGGVPAPEAGAPVHGPRHAPSSVPHQHGCCGCLGPCASGGLVGMPAPAPSAAIGALRVAAAATPPDARAVRISPRLLPFANGPPHHLG